jgi:ribosomal protein L24
MFLLQVRTKHDNGIWGQWLPHSAYATEQEVQEVCYTDVIDGQQWKYIKLSNQIQSDLKTVWLTKGTKVKIIAGSRQGYIGKIVEVMYLSVSGGCIYRIVININAGQKVKSQYHTIEHLYTQEQVVEYTQVEFCAGGAK